MTRPVLLVSLLLLGPLVSQMGVVSVVSAATSSTPTAGSSASSSMPLPKPMLQPDSPLWQLRGGNGFLAGSALASRRKMAQRNQQQRQQQQEEEEYQARLSSTSSSQSTKIPSSVASSSSKSASQSTSTPSLLSPKNLSLTTVTVIAIALVYQKRDMWLPLLDKKKIQDVCVSSLEQLRPTDPNDWGQRLQAYGVYAAGMAFWEFLGLSTIPVETAAGMVFQWPAAMASAIGKLVGASIAFGIGRTYLQGYVQTKLKDNAVCQLLAENGHRHHPLLSASLMKFSCFPEFVKNFGTAAFLPSVNYATFLTATCIHGVTFTLLWTWLGCETALYMAAERATSESAAATAATQTSLGLQIALIGMVLCGFVISPLSMAWWVRDLQKDTHHDDPKTKKAATATATPATPKWAFWKYNELKEGGKS